jgi:hypothetical protein
VHYRRGGARNLKKKEKIVYILRQEEKEEKDRISILYVHSKIQ